jgi:uncharacterized protein (TIGR03000 family)
MPPADKPAAKPGKSDEPPLPREKKAGVLESNRARVAIDVPADAKLYIDGQLMKTGSTRRVFQTPDLDAGKLYFYDLRVEVVRDGRVVSEEQRIILRPGQVASASFADLGESAERTARSE